MLPLQAELSLTLCLVSAPLPDGLVVATPGLLLCGTPVCALGAD